MRRVEAETAIVGPPGTASMQGKKPKQCPGRGMRGSYRLEDAQFRLGGGASSLGVALDGAGIVRSRGQEYYSVEKIIICPEDNAMCICSRTSPNATMNRQNRVVRDGGRHSTWHRSGLEMSCWDTLEEIAAKEGMSLAKNS